MRRTRNLLLAAVCAVLALTPAAEAGWMSFTSSVFEAQKKGQKHPETLSQMLIVRRDSPGAQVCATYQNNHAKKKQGRVVTRVGIARDEETIKTLTFAGGVARNAYVNCKAAGDLLEGDMVFFEFELKSMPRLGKGNFVEVNGVVSTAGEPPIERHGLLPAGDGGWIHSANSVFLPEQNRQKHPIALSRAVMMPRDAQNPAVCSAYVNTTKKKKAGRVVTTARILRVDGAQETVKLAGGVRRNQYVSCKPIGDLAEGDVVEFDFDLQKMPRLARESKKNRDFADIYGAVATCASADAAAASGGGVACGKPDFQGSGDAPDGPPGGGGPRSAGMGDDDYDMFCSTLVANKKTQIQRPRGNSPARYLLLGPRSTADSSGTKADLRNTGVGNTVAEAAADYKRKTGDNSLGNGCSLNARDRESALWYHNMSSAAGPTSIRRDSGGGYHADYWRPWAHVIKGGFGSVSAVVDFLKSEGL